MPTKDGKMPQTGEIREAIKTLEYKVNSALSDFRLIYDEPGVKIKLVTVDGSWYEAISRIDMYELRKQYNISQ